MTVLTSQICSTQKVDKSVARGLPDTRNLGKKKENSTSEMTIFLLGNVLPEIITSGEEVKLDSAPLFSAKVLVNRWRLFYKKTSKIFCHTVSHYRKNCKAAPL